MNPTSTPTLGRPVIYTCDTDAAAKLNRLGGRKYSVGEPVAGVIVRVLDNSVCNLTLFPDAEETLHMPHIPFSAGNQAGTWNYTGQIGVTEAQAAA